MGMGVAIFSMKDGRGSPMSSEDKLLCKPKYHCIPKVVFCHNSEPQLEVSIRGFDFI